ncbi:hypothetical protein CHITON_1489 [Thermococcus chitonophagus]|uniref:Uncharacterized protein n=1 Tax=Thermococcus chitonophagus TaxID=54262 RepID=A0A161K9K2_9EURY|nr:hypothetical protein CHITON_1489 [Thermococcus chitonophagus]
MASIGNCVKRSIEPAQSRVEDRKRGIKSPLSVEILGMEILRGR